MQSVASALLRMFVSDGSACSQAAYTNRAVVNTHLYMQAIKMANEDVAARAAVL